MGWRDRRKLESRFRRILHHLLKWRAQPGLRSPSWQRTLREQRRQAGKLLYPDALADALAETGLRPQPFPIACPFTTEQILDPGYLPEDDGCTKETPRL
jgi:Domain of unknown function DUF29